MVSQYFDAQETLGKEVISLTGYFMLYRTDKEICSGSFNL